MALGLPVGELLARVTAAEFAAWVEFARLEPFGSPVDDMRAGTLASAIVAPWGGKSSPGDWFKWGAESRGDWRDLQAAFVAAESRKANGGNGG